MSLPTSAKHNHQAYIPVSLLSYRNAQMLWGAQRPIVINQHYNRAMENLRGKFPCLGNAGRALDVSAGMGKIARQVTHNAFCIIDHHAMESGNRCVRRDGLRLIGLHIERQANLEG